MPEIEAVEAELGHAFRNRELLRLALTHKSRAFEDNPGERAGDNEQLEFLGDAILGFVVSECLVRQFPSYPEGRLSKIKSHLVSASHLQQVARSLQFGTYLLLGRGEELSGGRSKNAILADAIEALIAAMYLDSGLEPVRRFIVDRILAGFEASGDQPERITDYKSALQELAQSRKLPQPRYTIVEERGPDHTKTFVMEARVGQLWWSRAEGLSKKSASQRAAQRVLEQLQAANEAD